MSGSSPSDRFSPIKGGIKIANRKLYPEVGTLAAVVRDVYTGDLLLLSNWHVLYAGGGADLDEIVQPRPVGVGNVVAQNLKGIRNASVDCAIARLTGHRRGVPGVHRVSDRIGGVAQPHVGLRVVKSGVNGVSRGEVVSTNAEHTLPYDDGSFTLEHQLSIRVDVNSPALGKGDSGSLWMSDPGYQAIGLHFGGTSRQGFANPISFVVSALRALGIRIDFDVS